MTEADTHALEALTAHATAVSRVIVDAAGPEAVVAVFAGGSLAAGTVACFPAQPLEIYSDIDLYVVARDEDINAVRRAARAARDVSPAPGVSLLRPLDIGIYTRADLEAQPARPGTVGLRTHHRVFHGDPADVIAMLAAIETEIPPHEGLYLLENRVNELPDADANPGSPQGRLQRYLLVKAVLDGAAAVEIAAGGPEALPEGWDLELVAAAREARDDLNDYLAGPGDGVVNRSRVQDLLLEAWRYGARKVFPHASPDWATLLLHRCRAGDYKNNLREFLAMSAGLDRARPVGTRLRMAWTGTGLARYSAVDALRLGAVVDAVLTLDRVDDIGRRSLDGLRAYLDRLTGVFGFGEGALRDRVAGMHRVVSGG
jgi:hypothetical protein